MIEESEGVGCLVVKAVTKARRGARGRKEERWFFWEAEHFSKIPSEITIENESSGILCCVTFVGNHEKPTGL